MDCHREINLNKNKTYSAKERSSKVNAQLEAKVCPRGSSFRDFLESLPQILKADDLKQVARAVAKARKKEKPIIAMTGGHVIKTGCSPVLIDLVNKGFITHVASNGSAAIHDTELARFGHTSEEVASQIENGMFGMAHDTAAFVNNAARQVAGTGRPGDMLMGISTSGNSPNVLKAVQTARDMDMVTSGLLRKDGGDLALAVDYPLVVQSQDTARIQEAHIFLIHYMADRLETQLMESS